MTLLVISYRQNPNESNSENATSGSAGGLNRFKLWGQPSYIYASRALAATGGLSAPRDDISKGGAAAHDIRHLSVGSSTALGHPEIPSDAAGTRHFNWFFGSGQQLELWADRCGGHISASAC